MQDTIDAWLAARPEIERIKRLEIAAADAWFESLTVEQKHVLAELVVDGFDGMQHLRNRILKARIASDGRQKKNE
jgi:hypothetical protein